VTVFIGSQRMKGTFQAIWEMEKKYNAKCGYWLWACVLTWISTGVLSRM